VQTLDGFEIVRELGRGGMGVVYEARHPDLDRSVALKVILKDDASEDSLARFSREGELLARVRHPNVLRVHRLGECAKGPYLVTELLKGEELKDQALAGLEPQRAAAVIRDVASGLDALHRKGIVHRDLKPGNVFIQLDGTPVLLDFGLARDLNVEKLSQTGTVLGTPAFMSPEQAGDGSTDSLDPRTDVYGLGAVLFFLLARRPPFEGATQINLITQVLKMEPRWPSADWPDTPRDLEAICQHAMAKNPTDRYPTARALGADLTRFLEGKPVNARPRRTKSRRPAAFGVVTLCAGLAAIGAILAPKPPSEPTTDLTKAEQRARNAANQLARKTRDAHEKARKPLRAAKRRPTHREKHTALTAWLELNADHPDAPDAREARRLAQLEFPLFPITYPEGASPRVFGAIGNRFAVTGNDAGQIRGWDLGNSATWSLDQFEESLWRTELRAGETTDIAIDPTGQKVIFATSKGVRILDRTQTKPEVEHFAGFRGRVRAIGYSPENKILAIADHKTGKVSVFRWPSETQVTAWRTFDGFIGAMHLALSKDGALLAAGGGKRVEGAAANSIGTASSHLVVWDLSTAQEKARGNPNGRPSALGFIGDTHSLLIGDQSGNLYTIDAADVGEVAAISPADTWKSKTEESASGDPNKGLRHTAHNGIVTGVVCTRDGKRAATVSETDGTHGQLKFWQIETGEELRVHESDEGEFVSCSLSPDETKVLVGTTGGHAFVYSTEVE
jgi:serine/threonine protein kinase